MLNLTAISCDEPDRILNNTDGSNIVNGQIYDGACCENSTSNKAFCCFVSLKDDINKSIALKYFMILN